MKPPKLSESEPLEGKNRKKQSKTNMKKDEKVRIWSSDIGLGGNRVCETKKLVGAMKS